MLGSRFPLSTAAILVTCTIASFANAALDKPLVVPPVPSMDQTLLTHLVPARATLNQWSDGFIPQDCRTLAINEKLSPNDIEAFDIFYEDVITPSPLATQQSMNGLLSLNRIAVCFRSMGVLPSQGLTS